MAYMEKFEYTFLTCRGGKEIEVAEGEDPRTQTPNEEATSICSALGKRGFRVIRWHTRDGIKHIVMEKRYR